MRIAGAKVQAIHVPSEDKSPGIVWLSNHINLEEIPLVVKPLGLALIPICGGIDAIGQSSRGISEQSKTKRHLSPVLKRF